MLATPVVPMMLLAIGLSLVVPKIDLVLIGFPSVIIKLLIMPLIAFGYALIFGISDPIALKSVVLESAMPVMASAIMIVSIYRIEQTLAAFMTVFSMILSFITIPIIAWLLQRFGY
jgi:predicted permease